MNARILALLALALARAGAALVANLTVEYERDPAAIDISWNSAPRFGWQVSGGAQASYALTVSSTFPSNAQVWSSGVVASDSCTQIPYGGAALANDADYVWSVAVVFADGSQGSASGTFGTGPDDAAWAAAGTWIGGCTAGQASPQLRRSFALDASPILRAKAYATGLGTYTLHMNGARVGDGVDVLLPGWSTVPTARVLANAWDVSALVRAGENVLGIRLGMAKYGYVSRSHYSARANTRAREREGESERGMARSSRTLPRSPAL